MVAFNGSAEVKSLYLARVKQAREMGNIVTGTYGAVSDTGWRGCAVGIMVHGNDHGALIAFDARNNTETGDIAHTFQAKNNGGNRSTARRSSPTPSLASGTTPVRTGRAAARPLSPSSRTPATRYG